MIDGSGWDGMGIGWFGRLGGTGHGWDGMERARQCQSVRFIQIALARVLGDGDVGLVEAAPRLVDRWGGGLDGME